MGLNVKWCRCVSCDAVIEIAFKSNLKSWRVISIPRQPISVCTSICDRCVNWNDNNLNWLYTLHWWLMAKSRQLEIEKTRSIFCCLKLNFKKSFFGFNWRSFSWEQRILYGKISRCNLLKANTSTSLRSVFPRSIVFNFF